MYVGRKQNLSAWLFTAVIFSVLGVSTMLAGDARGCTGSGAPGGRFNGTQSLCEASAAGSQGGWQTYTQISPLYRVEWRSRRAQLEAKRFAQRIKRRLGRQYASRKQQFHKHQAAMERQRRASKRSKARSKARQFAAARRHAAQHMPKHARRHAYGPGRTSRKLPLPDRSSAKHWRALWRHGALSEPQSH